MLNPRRWVIPAAASAALLIQAGCGEKPSVDSTVAEGKVTGSVKIKGKPMTAGTITLDPSNYVRSNQTVRTGVIKADGTFEVTTLIGQNTVRVAGPATVKSPELGYYNQTIDVKSAGTTLEIDLPPK